MSLGQDSYLNEHGIRVLIYQPGATKTMIAVNSILGTRQTKGDFATSPLIPNHCLCSAQETFKKWMIERMAKNGASPKSVGSKVFQLSVDINPPFRKQDDEKGQQRAKFIYGDDYNGNHIREKLRKKFDVEKKEWANAIN